MMSSTSSDSDAVAEGTSGPDESPPLIDFGLFLESIGPSQRRPVSGMWETRNGTAVASAPQITLPCDDEKCGGDREFRIVSKSTEFFQSKSTIDSFYLYRCSNCDRTLKRFALSLRRIDQPGVGLAYKFGELPAFGPPTPARLVRLFGDDKDLFFKGRRSEGQGLDIGAFTYYRRVVESHKDQIFDEIICVSQIVGLPADKIGVISKAKAENQFTKALDEVKDALPQTLLIKGQNPMTLLHAALSGGIHGKSDAECLELAQAVRVVLIELADKMAAALNDEAELSAAVARLMQSRS